MVVISYLRPHKSKLANGIEVFLAVDSLLVFLSAVPDTPSEALARSFITSSPANSSDLCSNTPYVAPQVVFITLCYYTPLVVLLLVAIATAARHLWYVYSLKDKPSCHACRDT